MSAKQNVRQQWHCKFKTLAVPCIPVKRFAAVSQGEQTRESKANLSVPDTETKQMQVSHYAHSFLPRKHFKWKRVPGALINLNRLNSW